MSAWVLGPGRARRRNRYNRHNPYRPPKPYKPPKPPRLRNPTRRHNPYRLYRTITEPYPLRGYRAGNRPAPRGAGLERPTSSPSPPLGGGWSGREDAPPLPATRPEAERPARSLGRAAGRGWSGRSGEPVPRRVGRGKGFGVPARPGSPIRPEAGGWGAGGRYYRQPPSAPVKGSGARECQTRRAPQRGAGGWIARAGECESAALGTRTPPRQGSGSGGAGV